MKFVSNEQANEKEKSIYISVNKTKRKGKINANSKES